MSSTTSNSSRQMFEGVGAPVNLERIDDGYGSIDPTLDACCQREVSGLFLLLQFLAEGIVLPFCPPPPCIVSTTVPLSSVAGAFRSLHSPHIPPFIVSYDASLARFILSNNIIVSPSSHTHQHARSRQIIRHSHPRWTRKKKKTNRSNRIASAHRSSPHCARTIASPESRINVSAAGGDEGEGTHRIRMRSTHFPAWTLS